MKASRLSNSLSSRKLALKEKLLDAAGKELISLRRENNILRVEAMAMESAIGHLRNQLPDIDDDGIVRKISEFARLREIAEKAEGALCRAREITEPAHLYGEPSFIIGYESAQAALKTALSSSDPCPHAAEVERMKICTTCHGGCPDKNHPAVHHLCEECHQENVKAFNRVEAELTTHKRLLSEQVSAVDEKAIGEKEKS